MNSVLRKLLRIASEKNLPVIVYDSQSDRAGVLMDLDYFEANFQSGFFDSSWEEEEEMDMDDEEIEDGFEDEDEDFPVQDLSFSPVFVDEEEDQDTRLDETNKNLALWRAQREEKEREEIEKTLEEELLENPPADPFEEDYLHTPEWHKIGDVLETNTTPLPKTPETPSLEPSYHPVINSGGSLSWADWTLSPNPFPPQLPETILLTENEEESLPEESEEDPIFLEEPV